MADVKIEKRRQYREKMSAEVTYKDEKNQSFGGCITKDVSENGVCILVREFIPVGTILDFQFKLPLSQTVFYVKGKVMWANKLPYNETWELGVEIVTDKEYATLVRKFISSLVQGPR